MRVCHIIHGLGPGGAEQVLVDLAQVAEDGGFSMSVIGLVRKPDPVHARELRAAGVEVTTLDLRTRWDPRAITRTLEEVRRQGADLVHTHLKHADLVGAVVTRRLGLPQVSTLHVIEEGGVGGSRPKRWLAGRVRARSADRTIAVSDAQRRWYLDTFAADPARVVTVPNGVLDRTAPTAQRDARALRASLGVDPEVVLAAQVAIMRGGKGHEDLFDALRALPDELSLHVLVVGDGPERTALETMVRADRRLASRVTFTGYRSDVADLMGTVDLVVHPSHADALPTALIHALSARVAILATDVGGIPQIVGDEAGILVPPHRADLLREGLERLAGDPELRRRLGTAGRRRFEQQFEARAWAGHLAEVYTDVLSRHRRTPNRSGG